MLLLLLALAHGAYADTCLAGESYLNGTPIRATAVLGPTQISLKGFEGPPTADIEPDGAGVRGSHGEQGIPTLDGGLYWVYSGVRAVLYPTDCDTLVIPQRNVKVAVHFEGKGPKDWPGFQEGMLEALNRGNVSATWGSENPQSDIDYVLSIVKPRVETKSNKGAWSATATFTLKVMRIVHTQTGDISFEAASGAITGDNGIVGTDNKDAMIRRAQNAAMQKVPEWVHRLSELGLNMHLLSFTALGAELSWGRDDGVSPGQRYRVVRGNKQYGTVVVTSAPAGQPTSRAIWERRKLGAQLDGQVELEPLPRTPLVFGIIGGIGLEGGAMQNRAVELFTGGRWQMGVVGGEFDISLGAAPFDGADSAFFAANLNLLAILRGVHLGVGPGFVAATESDVYAPALVGTFVLPLAPKVSMLVRARTVPGTGDSQLQVGFSNW